MVFTLYLISGVKGFEVSSCFCLITGLFFVLVAIATTYFGLYSVRLKRGLLHTANATYSTHVMKSGKLLAVAPEEFFCIIFQAEPAVTHDERVLWSQREPKDKPRD